MAKASMRRNVEAGSRPFGGSPTHLLHRALKLALDLHAEASGPGAITQRQHTVLAAAAAAAGGGQTQNDIVRATGIDRSTLADLIARMLAKGLLERRRSATDARANTVRLSVAGRAALADSAAAAETADARLLAFLPGKKRESFVKALALLAAAADGGHSVEAEAPLATQETKRAREESPKIAKDPKAARKKKRKKIKRA